MAKPAKPKKSDDKSSKKLHKQARTEANRKKRVAKQTKRVEKKKNTPPKTPRGMARALRRWQAGTTEAHNPSHLMGRKEWDRIKQQPKQHKEKVRVLPTVLLNGELMTTEQAAVEARRLLAQKRRETAHESALV